MNLKQWYEWVGKTRALLFLVSVLVVIAIILINPPDYISEAPLIISFQGLMVLDFIKLLAGSAMITECLRTLFHRRTFAWTIKAHMLFVLSLLILQCSIIYFFGSPAKSSRYYNFAWTLIERKDFSRAVRSLDIALSYNPRNISAYLERGYAHKQLGAFEEAIEDYARATPIDPANAQVHEGMGQVYYSMGDYENALLHLRKAISIDSARSARLEQWIKAAEKAANQAL